MFQIKSGRSTKDAQTIIGGSGKGIVTTDRYGGYNFLEGNRRQICWAHLKRDFQRIAERGNGSKTIGEGLLEQTEHLFRLWRRVRDGTLQKFDFQTIVESIKQEVSKLLIEGTRGEHSKTKNTCWNILKLEDSLWTFTRIADVEPTNNAAERALRRAVLWRRKSFGTKSESGSQFVARILTVVTTLRQQGTSVLGFLQHACAAIRGGKTNNVDGLSNQSSQLALVFAV